MAEQLLVVVAQKYVVGSVLTQMLEMDPDPKMKLRTRNNYRWAAKSGRPVVTITNIGSNRVAKSNVETLFKYASSKHC